MCGPLEAERLRVSGLRSPELSTLVALAPMPRWTLLLRTPAETVERASRTVEGGGRERFWSGIKPKPVSATQMHSTHTTRSPRARQIASSMVCRSYVDTSTGISTRNRATTEKSYFSCSWRPARRNSCPVTPPLFNTRHRAECTHSRANYGQQNTDSLVFNASKGSLNLCAIKSLRSLFVNPLGEITPAVLYKWSQNRYNSN